MITKTYSKPQQEVALRLLRERAGILPPAPRLQPRPAVTRRLYWAYGSNLNVRQMTARCPRAVPLEAFNMTDTVLRFRGVADVAHYPGAVCPGGLWEVTEECEQALDLYEGVGHRLYTRVSIRISYHGVEHDVLLYQMTRKGIMPPSEEYLQTIVQGYEDFGLDLTRLERAVQHSWRRKDKTKFLRRRYRTAGKPALAQSIYVLENRLDDDGDEDA